MGRRKEIKNTLAELAQKERGTSDETLNDDGSVPEVSGSSSKNDFKSISEGLVGLAFVSFLASFSHLTMSPVANLTVRYNSLHLTNIT